MVKIKRIGEFDRMVEELGNENIDILPVIQQKIKWFESNPDDTRLENHPLTKRMEGKFSFSIDDDIRVVYEWLGKSSVRFLAIGRHNKVYSK